MSRTVHHRRRFRRVAFFFLVLLLPVAAWSLWDYVEARRLSTTVREIQSRGEPIASKSQPRVPEQFHSSAGAYYDAAAMLMDRSALSEIETGSLLRARRPRGADGALAGLAGRQRRCGSLARSGDDRRVQRLSGVPGSPALGPAHEGLVAGARAGRRASRRARWRRRGGGADPPDAHRPCDGRQPPPTGCRFSSIARSWISIRCWWIDRRKRHSQRLQQAIRVNDRDTVIREDAVNARGLLIESLWNPGSDWYGRPSVRFSGNPLEPLIYFVARPWQAHRVTRELRRMNAAVSAAAAPWPDRLKFSPIPMPTLSATRWRFLDSPADTIAYLHQQRALAFGRTLAMLRTRGMRRGRRTIPGRAWRDAAVDARRPGSRVHRSCAGRSVLRFSGEAQEIRRQLCHLQRRRQLQRRWRRDVEGAADAGDRHS